MYSALIKTSALQRLPKTSGRSDIAASPPLKSPSPNSRPCKQQGTSPPAGPAVTGGPKRTFVAVQTSNHLRLTRTGRGLNDPSLLERAFIAVRTNSAYRDLPSACLVVRRRPSRPASDPLACRRMSRAVAQSSPVSRAGTHDPVLARPRHAGPAGLAQWRPSRPLG